MCNLNDVRAVLIRLHDSGLERMSIPTAIELLTVLDRLECSAWVPYVDLFEGITRNSRDYLCTMNSRSGWWVDQSAAYMGRGRHKEARLAPGGRRLVKRISAEG